MSLLGNVRLRAANVTRRSGRLLRELGFALRDSLGQPLPGIAAPGHSVVLMYHGVVPSEPSLLNWRHVSVADFEGHLRMLRKHCNIVPLAKVFSGDVDNRRLNVAITFDDGFRNNFEVAIPILQRYSSPASLYVTAANAAGMSALWPDYLDIVTRFARSDVQIDGRTFTKRGRCYVCRDSGNALASVIRTERPDWPFKQAVYRAFSRWDPNLQRPDLRQYWELMTDRHIAEAAAVPGITIGSHGYYHNNLGSVSREEALQELRESKTYLENLVQREVQELAYPDGSYTPAIVGAAEGIGFIRQLAVDHRFGEKEDSLLPLRRHGVYSMAPMRSQLVDALAS
jgi:peptidoglycan/xylan/chitin deacetylase (PgdA/CDA1 family)